MSKDQAIGGAILACLCSCRYSLLSCYFSLSQLIQPWLNIGSAADVNSGLSLFQYL